MKTYRYRVLQDHLFLERGEHVQLSAGGDFYPTMLGKWCRSDFRISAATIEGRPDIFAPHNLSDAEWELANLDLTHELE
jgi:hypothetical protein